MKSMTGFGRSKLEKNGREYIVEIKSVNHRFNEISVKLPRNLSYMEETIKKEITNQIARGKVDIFITFNNYSEEGKNVIINQELAITYINQLKELADVTGLEPRISITEISKMPDVLQLKLEDADSEMISEELMECVHDAVENFITMRWNEGQKIKEDLEKRLSNIEEMICQVSKFSTGLIQEYIVKLEERVKELLKTDIVNKDRLAQEIVIYADKTSIEEELTRLNSHVSQFKMLLNETGSVGKKIDFLIQEMNRETNTIGSKSASIDITNIVIHMKTQLEDIREQVQNIE